MAWTHDIKSSTGEFYLIDDAEGDAVVAIDRSIYVIGYDYADRELQLHIFRVGTSRWDVVLFPDHNGDSIPRDMKRFFAVAHGDSILVFAENYFMECSLFFFNTRTLQWNRVSLDGDVSGYDHWWGGCLLHEELYIIKEGNASFELMALDLGTMRWRIVSEIELEYSYCPIRIVAYETRIYMHFENMYDDNNYINIAYYDTINRKWDRLHVPWHIHLSRPTWASFFYSKYFYYVSGIFDRREFVFRYSLERNEWERIRFEGVSPLNIYIAGNAIVLDNKAFFFEFCPVAVHVLDLDPSLTTRCLVAVTRYELDASDLPVTLQTELSKYKRSA